MVEIFKTDVWDAVQATRIINNILEHKPYFKVNFDLTDCDKILRIESQEMSIIESEIVEIVNIQGYKAEIIED